MILEVLLTDIVALDEDSCDFWMAKAPFTQLNTVIGVLNEVDKLKLNFTKDDGFRIRLDQGHKYIICKRENLCPRKLSDPLSKTLDHRVNILHKLIF